MNKAIAAPGKTLYYLTRKLTPKERDAIISIHAIFRELYSLLFKCETPMAARLRLQWWRDEISRLFAGDPQHPITRANTHLAQLDKGHFFTIINAIDNHFDQPEFRLNSDVQHFMIRTGGSRDWLIMQVLKLDKMLKPFINKYSQAIEIIHFLRNLKKYEHHSCSLRLKTETPNDLAQKARALLADFPANLPYFSASTQLHLALLKKIEKRQFSSPAHLTPIRKLLLTKTKKSR